MGYMNYYVHSNYVTKLSNTYHIQEEIVERYLFSSVTVPDKLIGGRWIVDIIFLYISIEVF